MGLAGTKTVQQLNAAVEGTAWTSKLYKVQDRVSQVYLSVLYLDQQLKQVELAQKPTLDTGSRKVDAMVQDGTTFRSGLSMLQAEQLKARTAGDRDPEPPGGDDRY